MAQIDLKDATIKIKDGAATQNEIEVTIGEGNLTWTERKNIEYVLDRGNLDEVREGDQAPVELSIDAIWEYIKSLSGSGTPTIEDALKNVNEASTWESSDSDACRPYAVDIEIYYVPDCATGDTELITFSDFRYEQLDHDLRAATISVSGRCNITMPTASRLAQSTGS
jgi:hypothetical protein